jgi:hypothetical protein
VAGNNSLCRRCQSSQVCLRVSGSVLVVDISKSNFLFTNTGINRLANPGNTALYPFGIFMPIRFSFFRIANIILSGLNIISGNTFKTARIAVNKYLTFGVIFSPN